MTDSHSTFDFQQHKITENYEYYRENQKSLTEKCDRFQPGLIQLFSTPTPKFTNLTFIPPTIRTLLVPLERTGRVSFIIIFTTN